MRAAASAVKEKVEGEVDERVAALETWLAEVEDKVSAAAEAAGAEDKGGAALEMISELQASFAEHKASVESSSAEMAAKMDANGDGTIDKSEFTVWAEEQGKKVAELESRLTAALAESKLRFSRQLPLKTPFK